MGPCADKRVRCEITTKDGRGAVGFNDCENPQETCPRAPGEGYEKCKSICRQEAHAEIVAVRVAREAGLELTGARATLYGIGWICQHCRQHTEQAGIERIYVGTTK